MSHNTFRSSVREKVQAKHVLLCPEALRPGFIKLLLINDAKMLGAGHAYPGTRLTVSFSAIAIGAESSGVSIKWLNVKSRGTKSPSKGCSLLRRDLLLPWRAIKKRINNLVCRG